MSLSKISLSDSVEKNITTLQKKVEDNKFNFVIRNGKILFKDVDKLNIKTNSSDKVLKGETTIFIFRKSEDDLLIDTELILYPQYVSINKDRLINNKRINNILASFETYVGLMNESKSNNNTKVGKKNLDIVKANFNEDKNLDDLRNYCAPEAKCESSMCCKGSNKYYYLFTRCFDNLSDLFYIYALKRSSKEKHHRVSSNWSNKIINYEVPHLSENNYTDDIGSKVSWSKLNLDLEAKHNSDNQSKKINSRLNKRCDLNTFSFKNKSEIEKKVKQIVKVIRNTNNIRYLTISLSFLVHSNRILIDIKNKRIIRIEPHGFGKSTFYDVKQLDCLIQDIFSELGDFDYVNEGITNNDIPKEILNLFNTYSVQGTLPLCQIYSAYVQLLSIHYPKYTIITLNEIVSKHNISKRIQNFFKLFFEFLDKNIDIHTLLNNKNEDLQNIHNESKPIYTWLFTKSPEELNPTLSKECKAIEEQLNDKIKKINDKLKIFNQNVDKFNAMKTATEQQNFKKEYDESKNDYEKSKDEYKKSKAEKLKCRIDYSFGLFSNDIVTVRNKLHKIHNLSEKFIREKNNLKNGGKTKTNKNTRPKNKKNNTKKSSYSNIVKKKTNSDKWCKAKAKNGKPYYYSHSQKPSKWKKPFIGNDIPINWCRFINNGNVYYYNRKTKKTQRKHPI